MSATDNTAFPGFGQLIPGFDFLQNLSKQATGAASSVPQIPGLGSWIAPTLNVEELDKRIQELKAVQFWLDQNATALKATIQALELQKMTLATLKGMNFSMSELTNAFKLKTPAAATKFAGLEVPPSAFQAAQAAEASKLADDEPEEDEDEEQEEEDETPAPVKSANGGGAGVVDPMQWWGALTQQFQSIATEAMQEAAKKSPLTAGKTMADDAVKAASDMATGVAKSIADTASKTAAGSVRAMSTALRSNQAWPTPGVKENTASAASKPKAKAKPVVKSAKAASPARKAARKTSR